MTKIWIVSVCVCILASIARCELSPREKLDMAQLGRQLMLQQLFVEEKIRADGDSGIKIARLNTIGSRPYDAEGFSAGSKVASIHNHDNNIRTIGMGEFVAVLNGVEFRTRHNDYRLYMPSETSDEFHATQDVPFPDVPAEVLKFKEVEDQVTEMKEWFRAFKEQNITHRDYTQYFKPVLCYLEGAWTTSTETLDESFESDRHFTDAESWHDLQEKIRFTSSTGRKSLLENFSYLPTTITHFINDTTPVMAQWNYRILCHPLSRSLPTNRFKLIDDLVTRMRDRIDFYELGQTRGARFSLNPIDSDEWTDEKPEKQLLDELMGEVPGVNNYGAYILDDAIGGVARDVSGDEEPLNVAYYNRVFKVDEKDAMGLDSRRRGFNDQNVFMAATDKSEVAPMSATFCEGSGKNKVCKLYTERWTYAIPLEIIYLTPLSSWNPYNLEYKGDYSSDEGATVTANGRNGESDASKAYDGIHSKLFFMTPADLYSGSDLELNDPADTSTGSKWVLDPSGEPREVSTSGTRIRLKPIEGVGSVRQRYPIMPLHDDGNNVYKALEALMDIVLEPQTYDNMLRGAAIETLDEGLKLKLAASNAQYGAHEHYVELTGSQVESLYEGNTVEVTTSMSGDPEHSHDLLVYQRKEDDGTIFYKYVKCDGETFCEGRHSSRMIIVE